MIEYVDKIFVSQEKIKEIRKLLSSYKHIFVEVHKEKVISEILNAYKFKKPLTSIEIDDKHSGEKEEFVDKLRERFYVLNVFNGDNSCGTIYVSRFKTIIKVVDMFTKSGYSLDYHADLFGILFGYDLENVAGYIIDRNLDDMIKIRDDEINN
jgi:hypothetical protein